MTEYDYSPAAVERYMENQSRVSNWVHRQANHAAEYASPFVPHPSSSNSSSSRDSPLDDRSYDRYDRAYRDHDRDRSSTSRHSESSGHRPSVRRSTTSVTPHTTYRDKHSPSHSQSQVPQLSQYPRTREIYAPPPPPPVTPVTPVSPQQYHSSRAHHHHHHHQLQAYDPDSYFPPSSSGQTYKTFTIDPANTREIVLRPPRRGETYVIIPPAGQRIEVVVSLLSLTFPLYPSLLPFSPFVFVLVFLSFFSSLTRVIAKC